MLANYYLLFENGECTRLEAQKLTFEYHVNPENHIKISLLKAVELKHVPKRRKLIKNLISMV